MDSNSYPTFLLPIYFGIILAVVLAFWKIFTKAGQPGLASLVPFYNMYILLKIVGRPGWWLLLLFIPLVNIVISLLVALDLAKAFGKSTIFGVLALWLFSLVGYLILAFDNSTYQGLAAPVTFPAPQPAIAPQPNPIPPQSTV